MKYAGLLPVVLMSVMLVSPVDVFRGDGFRLLEETGTRQTAETEESGKSAEARRTGQHVVKAGESSVGGITLLINKYYSTMDETKQEAQEDGFGMKAVHRVPSPYENLGIAHVDDYVNIRSGPSTDYKILGKLYNGCVANILGYEGDWVKIQSGNLEEGYIKAEFLLIGWEAEDKIEEYCDKVATVNCDVLNVRTGMSTQDRIYDQIPNGESYYVAEEYEEWVEIILGQDDSTGQMHTGYVYKEFVDLTYEYQYAITIEEEQARIAAEEAARKAEEERLRKLAEEEAARKAAEEARRKAEEEAKKAEAQAKAEAEEAKRLLEQQQALATESAKLRQEVASYALNFVGNPYVWGGTSLTKGADCSGFVQSIYKQFGYTIPRVSRDQAVSAGYCDVKPDPEHLLPGDLIFYKNNKGVVSHVAMYIGDGKVVHAADVKSGIKVSSYLLLTPYKARRVIE
ncbi:MAG: C40 family peptidase [Lachnospiraceae bacterium]|nr:C40 family peptidase [Lachnospiraceae bacterium]